MGKAQREKGKRGERLAAKLLRDCGFESARRGIQYKGGVDSPDVACEEFPYHIEVKNTKRMNIDLFSKQANKDSQTGEYVILHKQPRKPWLAIIPPALCLHLMESITLSVIQSKRIRLWREMEEAELHAETKTAALMYKGHVIMDATVFISSIKENEKC